jgi:hypothetical protein
MIANELVKSTEVSEKYVSETFENLLTILNIEKDIGFKNLDELVKSSISKM